MSDVVLVCGSCGDRRSVTEISLGEICRSCHMDGYRLGYGVYFGKPIDLPEPAPTTIRTKEKQR
jgi:hypothetical protein